ncbi:MAG: methyltransferase domain-containing protein [bacterium]|nr:methyltransferase domain-containing protein [bacterium]
MTKQAVFADKNILHLGCGKNKVNGALGIDKLNLPQVDIQHDMDVLPWPLDDNNMDVVIAHSLIEHIDDLIGFFKEVWRISKPGGRLIVVAPYFRCVDSFTDPTHKHFFTARSLDYFLTEKNSLSDYEYTKINFKKVDFWYGYPHSKNVLSRYAKEFFKKNSYLYDQYISLFFPVKIVVWELEVVK